MDSGFQVLDSSQWNLDSGSQSLLGFPILKAVFKIPKLSIPDFISTICLIPEGVPYMGRSELLSP